MQDIDKEKLRAFEQKMHDEGADGFADGPRPWETWDESGAQAGSGGKRVWEGKARRIYKTTQVQRSLGDRILSSLAMISLTTMAVGIAGVYLTKEQPKSVAWTAVQPTPIPLETTNRQQLPARVMRPAPVIADIESLPPAAAGSPIRATQKTATERTAGDMSSLAGTETRPVDAAAPVVSISTAPAPADDHAGGPAVNDSDIEVVTAPAALLLTGTLAASPDGSNEVSEYQASEMEIDPELAMEIATAPALDSDMDDEPVTVTSMATQETGAGSTMEGVEGATHPATNMINRGTASLAAADSGLPEIDTTPAGFAAAAAVEATATDTEPAPLAASLTDATTAPDAGSERMAATDMAALESLPPVAAGRAATATEIPVDSDVQARDIPPATGKEPPAGETTVAALADPEPAAVAPSPAAVAAAPTGDWVVNLASYTYESTARRKLVEFQAKGVTGEIERITVNDKPLYRIRVTGFASSRSARASIPALQEALGLEGAWIARR